MGGLISKLIHPGNKKRDCFLEMHEEIIRYKKKHRRKPDYLIVSPLFDATITKQIFDANERWSDFFTNYEYNGIKIAVLGGSKKQQEYWVKAVKG